MGVGCVREFQRFSDNWVFDFVDGLNPLQFGVFNNNLLLKCFVQREVDVFVDRRGNKEPAVL